MIYIKILLLKRIVVSFASGHFSHTEKSSCFLTIICLHDNVPGLVSDFCVNKNPQ